MANQVICLRWRTQPNSASMAGDAIASARPLGLFFGAGSTAGVPVDSQFAARGDPFPLTVGPATRDVVSTRRTRPLSVGAAQQKQVVVCCVALQPTSGEVFSRNLRLSDYLSNAATSKVGGCDASKRSAIDVRTGARTVMENPAKQRAPASSEIVKLIRKLRWAGLEEKAEQLEKELDRHTVTDTVVSIQNETD
jgi:hypothetical protein